MQLSPMQIQSMVIEAIDEITQDWDLESDESIALETLLVEDLGFASMDFVQLVVTIEDLFQKKLGFHDLLMQNGEYVEDLSVEQLVNFIDRKLNSQAVVEVSDSGKQHSDELVSEKINLTKIDQFRNVVSQRVAQIQQASPSQSQPLAGELAKNKPAVFILSPPRSGSTLLRVILAGHPQLFAPPELHLLSYQTLAQRQAALAGEQTSHLLQGTIRAIMQLKNYSAEAAERLMQEYEDQQMTTQQFYNQLQTWLGDKTLVDKTPTYASHLDILKRAETDFEQPLYLHLLRHPYGAIRSYEESKLDRIVPIMNESSFSRRELAELTWLISHQNILDFLQHVPQQRQYRIQYEDLVENPQASVESICQFLGLEFHEDMLDPYKEKAQRMTDGVQVVSKMSGDLKFHLHGGIEADAAHRWKRYYTVDFLGDITRKLAESLGYNLAELSNLSAQEGVAKALT